MRSALIVVGELDVGRLLAEHLAHQGFQSKLLTEGLPVMSHAREGQPDLIILNYNSLPDVYGADVCRASRPIQPRSIFRLFWFPAASAGSRTKIRRAPLEPMVTC
jgi:DNA-binding response OmpR family regulator